MDPTPNSVVHGAECGPRVAMWLAVERLATISIVQVLVRHNK